MTDIKRNEIVIAWALLVALTAVSWWLGGNHGGSAAIATTVILVVSFVKVVVIGHSFMEVGHASRLLRTLFFGLSTLICVTLVGIYLTA